MKKILTNIKLTTLGTIAALVLLISPNFASATFYDIFYDIPYIVTHTNIPPVADAGADKVITLPTDFVTITGANATDPDGIITSALWTQVSGPSTALIMNGPTIPPNTPYPKFANLVAGTYTFRLTIEDNATPHATDFDDMIVVVNPVNNQPITVTLTANPTTLPAGGGTTNLTWTSQNAAACASPHFNTNGDTNGGPLTVFVPGTTTFDVTCTGVGAPATASVTVTVDPSNPGPVTALIDALPYTLPQGGGNTTLVWDTNGTSCTGINFSTGGLPTGSKVVSLTSTTTYEVYCTDGNLTAQDDVTVTVSGNNNPINGMCAPNHWYCSLGTAINKVTGTNSWTWSCQGSNGGTTAACSESATPTYQCSDNIDNDGDGKIDYPADPGCLSTIDNDETNGTIPPPQCSDGIDNDGDGKIDYPNDPGCQDASDDNEVDNAKPQCSDNKDNDGDGKIDYPNDPGCDNPTDDNESNTIYKPQCSDGMDNDFDAYIDYPDDPGCSSPSDDEEFNGIYVPQCSDLKDNDSDGLIDYPDDSGCTGPNDNSESNGSASPQCSDLIDNDGDKLVDTEDPGCHSDKNPKNDASYLPSKNSEKESIKPIFIEI